MGVEPQSCSFWNCSLCLRELQLRDRGPVWRGRGPVQQPERWVSPSRSQTNLALLLHGTASRSSVLWADRDSSGIWAGLLIRHTAKPGTTKTASANSSWQYAMHCCLWIFTLDSLLNSHVIWLDISCSYLVMNIFMWAKKKHKLILCPPGSEHDGYRRCASSPVPNR